MKKTNKNEEKIDLNGFLKIIFSKNNKQLKLLIQEDKNHLKQLDLEFFSKTKNFLIDCAINFSNFTAVNLFLDNNFSHKKSVKLVLEKFCKNQKYDPIPALKTLLTNENAKYYEVSDQLIYQVMFVNKQIQTEIPKLIQGNLWKKIKVINSTFLNSSETESIEDYCQQNSIKLVDFNKHKDVIKYFFDTALTKNKTYILYDALKFVSKFNMIDLFNYGKEDKLIFYKAINFKKWDILKIMLQAINQIEISDKTKTLNDLVVISEKLVTGLCKNMIKYYDVNTQDNKGNTLLHYAILHYNFDLVKLLAEKADFTVKNNEGDDILSLSTKQQNWDFTQKNAFKNLDNFKLIKEYLDEKIREEKLIKPNKNEQIDYFYLEKKEIFQIQPEKIKIKTKKHHKQKLLQKLSDNYGANINNAVFDKLNHAKIDLNDYKKFIEVEELKKEDKLTQNKEIFSWIVNNEEYLSKNLFCHKFGGQEYYFTISSTLKLDKIKEKNCLNIIEKGFAKASKNELGIKLFNSIMEIKDYSEARVYADCGYQNEKGAILVIFNKTANHTEIKKLAQAQQSNNINKLQIIDHSVCRDEAKEKEINIEEYKIKTISKKSNQLKSSNIKIKSILNELEKHPNPSNQKETAGDYNNNETEDLQIILNPGNMNQLRDIDELATQNILGDNFDIV